METCPHKSSADAVIEVPVLRNLEVLPGTVESPEWISQSGLVILHHAGQGEADPSAFLPCLRRGESVSVNEIAELARALQALDLLSFRFFRLPG